MNEKNTQLILINNPLPQPVELFNADKAEIDKILEMVQAKISAFNYGDFAVEKNRKAVKSLAFKVAQTKTAIDNAGKDFLVDVKAKIKTIDDARKYARDELDKLRDKAKQPLADWEAEQERIRIEEEAKKIQKEIDDDHELAVFMYKDWQDEQERLKKEKEEAEKARIEKEELEQKRREDEAAKAAKLKAEQDAENKIRQAKKRKRGCRKESKAGKGTQREARERGRGKR